MFFDNKMFYWDQEELGIYELDLGNETANCLYSGPVIGSDGTSYNNVVLYADPFDNHILGTATNEQGESIQVAFDIASKTFQELTLIEEEKPIQLLAESPDHFLVQKGLKEYPVPDYTPDGQQYTTNMLVPDLYLIAKNDYWNNIPNYIPIKDNVYI